MKPENALKTPKQRQSNFELLRIISMILILCHHYVYHGGVNLAEQQLSLNKIILQFLLSGGKLGVNIFILISGYFLIVSGFKMKKAVKLFLQITFYSGTIMILFYILGYNSSLKGIIIALFPMIFNVYWFATAYFIMYILSNYINIFIFGIGRKKHLRIILILSVIFSVLTTFIKAAMIPSELLWFFVLYLIAAYIRLYSPRIFESKWCLLVGIGIYSLQLIWRFAGDILVKYFNNIKYDDSYLYMYPLPIFLSAVFIFAGFKNIKIKKSRFINTVASATFGVYLIHDNTYIRKVLWTKILKCPQYYNSSFLIVHALVSIAMVYIICTVIDLIYHATLEKWIWILINKYWDKWRRVFFDSVTKCKQIFLKHTIN